MSGSVERVGWIGHGDMPCLVPLLLIVAMKDAHEAVNERFEVGVAAQPFDFIVDLLGELSARLPRVLHRAELVQQLDAVPFQVEIERALLENVNDPCVGVARVHGVQNGKGEFAFGEILAEGLVRRVLLRGEIAVVVADLEEQREQLAETIEAVLVTDLRWGE